MLQCIAMYTSHATVRQHKHTQSTLYNVQLYREMCGVLVCGFKLWVKLS